MLAFLVAAQTFVADRFEKKFDRGATAVEYGIMVAAIAVVVIIAAFALGDTVTGMFENVDEQVGDRVPAPAGA